MTVRTQGVWNDADFEAVRYTIHDEVAILMSQGKTDGINDRAIDTPVVGQSTSTRTWDSQQTAEQFLTFIYSLGVDPVSYVILPD